MRSIRWIILAAVAVLPFALSAQIMRISPFLGTDQETWDDFPLGQQTSYSNPNLVAFDGIAVFGSPYLSIYRTTDSFYEPGGFGLGAYTAKTQSGQFGLGKAAESDAPVTIGFAVPINAFGGYWAALSGFFPNESHAITFRFLASDGALVGADTFVYSEPKRDGTLEWVGWSFSRPVNRIEYAAWYVVNDSLRITAVPEPSAVMLLVTGSAACLFFGLRTQKNSKAAKGSSLDHCFVSNRINSHERKQCPFLARWR